MKKIKYLLIAFILLVFFPQTVRAQSLGLGIYPPLLEVTIMPGKTLTQVYHLTNSGEVNLTMTSAIVAFEPSDETGGVKIIENTEKLQPLQFGFLNADLRLGQTFSLPTGKTQEVVLIIKVPETAPEKDYYAILLFQTSPLANLGGQSASQTQTKIGSPLLISVSRTGEPFRKASIEEFSLKNCAKLCIIDSFSPPQWLVRIKNSGHSFFKPLGKITLQGWLNQTETLDLLPQNILSDSTREIQCQKEDQVVSCQSQSKFLIGPFKAKLEFGLDDFSNDYQKEIQFIALPFKLGFGLLILVIILGLIKSKLVLDRD